MIWVNVNQVSKLLSITDRAVRRQVYNGVFEYRYITGRGKGGKVLQIALESLPQSAQDKYNGIDKPLDQSNYLTDFTVAQQEAAEKKCRIVRMFQSSGKSGKRFIEDYNAESGGTISLNQLYDWQKRLKEGGLPALVDTRGTSTRGKSSISDEAWSLFCDLYLTQQKRSIALCYGLVKAKFPDIPSVSAFERRVKNELPELVLLRYREPIKKFKDALPYHIRTKKDIDSNDTWSSDHHTCDTFVLDKRGKAVRLTLTVIVDIRSTKILSFKFRPSPGDTSVVKMCLRDAMIEFGIPKEFYTDNGKDYKSKELSSGEESDLTLTEVLGIKQIFAQPYHGQSKPVERFFRTFEESYGKLFKTYAGSNAVNRTDATRMTNKQLAKQSYIPTMDEYISHAADFVDQYNSSASTADEMDGKSPNEVYRENLHCKRKVNGMETVLSRLCGRFEERTVQRNGVNLLHNFYYNDSGALLPYFGKRVIVNYDPEDLSEMLILDKETKRFICRVRPKAITPFRHATEEDIKTVKREQRNVYDYVNGFKPHRTTNSEILFLVAKKQLLERNFEEQSQDGKDEIETEIIETPIIEAVSDAVAEKSVKAEARVDEDDEDFFLTYYNDNKDDFA